MGWRKGCVCFMYAVCSLRWIGFALLYSYFGTWTNSKQQQTQQLYWQSLWFLLPTLLRFASQQLLSSSHKVTAVKPNKYDAINTFHHPSTPTICRILLAYSVNSFLKVVNPGTSDHPSRRDCTVGNTASSTFLQAGACLWRTHSLFPVDRSICNGFGS